MGQGCVGGVIECALELIGGRAAGGGGGEGDGGAAGLRRCLVRGHGDGGGRGRRDREVCELVALVGVDRKSVVEGKGGERVGGGGGGRRQRQCVSGAAER